MTSKLSERLPVLRNKLMVFVERSSCIIICGRVGSHQSISQPFF